MNRDASAREHVTRDAVVARVDPVSRQPFSIPASAPAARTTQTVRC